VVEWVACATGLIGLSVVLYASVDLLRSHELTFSVDAAAAFEEAEEDGVVDDPEDVRTGLVYFLSAIQAANGTTADLLKRAFAWRSAVWSRRSSDSVSRRRWSEPMATHSAHDSRPNGRWMPSRDVGISEKRGISGARDPRTRLLKSQLPAANGQPPPRGKRG
jgi:hypothetical protein